LYLDVLRYIEQEKDESDPEDGLANWTSRVKNGQVQRNIHNFLLTKAMKAHEDLLESMSSVVSSPGGGT